MATTEMPRPVSSAGPAPPPTRQVVPIRHLDDQPAVGAAQPEARGRGAVLKSMRHQLAGGQDSEVAYLGLEMPGGEHALGAGPGARGRLEAAEEVQRCVVEELGVRTGAGRTLKDHHGDVVAVVGVNARVRMSRSQETSGVP